LLGFSTKIGYLAAYKHTYMYIYFLQNVASFRNYYILTYTTNIFSPGNMK